MIVLHISSVDPNPNSGMGRVSYHWKSAFEKAGHFFLHIGLNEIGHSVHPLLRGLHFRKYILDNKIETDLIMAHEPLVGYLKFKNVPLVSFSHGVEQRAWKNQLQFFPSEIKLISKLIPPSLRFFSNTIGFKKADLVFVLSTEDREYLIETKNINSNKICIFKNGYYALLKLPRKRCTEDKIVFLFNASWLKRKGIDLVISVFNEILSNNKKVRLIISGCQIPESIVLSFFDRNCQDKISVITSFDAAEENYIYRDADVFILPSYFEGQSLALIQAMSMALCPIVSDNSGQKDIIEHNVNGLLFSTGDKDSFQKQVEFCIHQPELSASLGLQACETIKDNTWEIVSNEMVKVCEKLVLEK